MSDGFIILHRKFLNWGWYQDQNTKAVFLHLLLKANHADRVWKGIEVKRGQCITSSVHLAEELGLSRQCIRTSLNRLKSTNEITIKTTNKYTLITLVKYDFYQDRRFTANQHSNQHSNLQLTNKQPTTNQQLTTNNNDNNIFSSSSNNARTREIYQCYEENIGVLTGMIAEELDGYLELMCSEAVIYAIKQAVLYNKKSLGYVKGVCKALLNAGVKTPLDLERYIKEQEEQRRARQAQAKQTASSCVTVEDRKKKQEAERQSEEERQKVLAEKWGFEV